MNNKIHVKRIIILIIVFCILFAAIWWVADTISYLKEKAEYLDSCKQFCPMNFPNTLWLCAEDEAYFVVDKSGTTLGAVRIAGEIKFFALRFNSRSIENGFSLCNLDNISYPKKGSSGHCFYGSPKYSENCCILEFFADDDTEHYFGEREGKVTLTFIKSDLPAPFSFDSEECLNELPFR